ncbi:hypothetical protein Shyhy01_43980 [Streptomyces hygroscopicus subsp. hygroscopicus]|nr:response regulator transcription factor [Streptomyces hygroscopicus]GLX51448.1 hypothetical protein Shyhy01_43980 [Streptomyces hygroscopicus subsp. hygroscopicus]
MTWPGSPRFPAEERPSRPLTGRERQILELVAQGMTNRAVARNLSISESTVKNHLRAVFAKLRVTDRTQVARLAVRGGTAPGDAPAVGCRGTPRDGALTS